MSVPAKLHRSNPLATGAQSLDSRSLETVVVRFRSNEEQSAQLERLKEAVVLLMSADLIRKAQVEAVFVGAKDPELASLFVVRFLGSASDTAEYLRRLRGVIDAGPAAGRRTFK
jgi:hypothetical protein